VSLRDVTSVGAQRSNHRRVGAAVIHAALAQLREAGEATVSTRERAFKPAGVDAP
jgi:hypothetical protein